MTAYTPPPPHRIPLPTRTPTRTKVIPRRRNRVCALVGIAGLAIALLSIYLPWLNTGRGDRISALGITDLIDVRSVAPVLFLGLVGLFLLVVTAAVTRLGAFALAAAVVASGILTGHLAFVWILIASTGASEPMVSGLPSDASVTFGPWVAALGFVMVAVASARSALASEYVRSHPGSGGRATHARRV